MKKRFSLLIVSFLVVVAFVFAQTQINGEGLIKILINLIIQLLQGQQLPSPLPKTLEPSTTTEIKSGGSKFLTPPMPVTSTPPMPATSTPPIPCYTFNKDIKIGDQLEDVIYLRKFLKAEGFNIDDKSDIYDEKLASAVSGFQEKYRRNILTPLGLKYGTGYFGPATRKLINKLYGCKTADENIKECGPAPLYPSKEGCKRVCLDGKWQDICPATPTPITTTTKNECIITGCSGQICAEEEMITTCEWKPEYECYKKAKCERQPDGKCGWTMSPELRECLRSRSSLNF